MCVHIGCATGRKQQSTLAQVNGVIDHPEWTRWFCVRVCGLSGLCECVCVCVCVWSEWTVWTVCVLCVCVCV